MVHSQDRGPLSFFLFYADTYDTYELLRYFVTLAILKTFGFADFP